jgi:tRNA dimethylallyltransferase
MMYRKLLVVEGPTASGKSGLGIALAREFRGEIVSADSRQVYCGLDIGTAKITPEERALVPHHLLDVAEPAEVYTVARFQKEALAAIEDILARGCQPLLVGGSPHYIQAVVDHLDIPPVAPQPELRAQLEARSLPDLLAELERLDPVSFASIDRQNPRRVIRALEVCLVSGQPFSQQRRRATPLYDCLQIAVDWPRAELYARIDQRVDERIEQGMIAEVHGLISRWLRGEFPGQAEMVQRLKFAIHDFTRRQLTWFRKDQRITWIDGHRLEAASDIVQEFLG